MGMPAGSASGMNRDDSSRNLASMEAMLQRLMALPAAPGEAASQAQTAHPQRPMSAPVDSWSPSSSTWGPLADVWKSGGQSDPVQHSQAESVVANPVRPSSYTAPDAPRKDASAAIMERRTWLTWFSDLLDDMASSLGPVGRFLATTPGHWVLALAGIGFWGLAAYILTGGTIAWPTLGNSLE